VLEDFDHLISLATTLPSFQIARRLSFGLAQTMNMMACQKPEEFFSKSLRW
jgi:hypothetical protein